MLKHKLAASILKHMLAKAENLWFKSQQLRSVLLHLVEASGFEPLSENNVTIASTSIVVVFGSRLAERPTTGNPLDQPDYLRHLSPGGEQMPHPTNK